MPDTIEIIKNKLDNVEELLKQQNLVLKPILTFKEAAAYLGVSESYLYKLTSKNLIKHSKPSGKLIFLQKKDLDEWMLKGRVASRDEIEEQALQYINRNKKGKVMQRPAGQKTGSTKTRLPEEAVKGQPG
jgi:excisionase family DNA binding protein